MKDINCEVSEESSHNEQHVTSSDEPTESAFPTNPVANLPSTHRNIKFIQLILVLMLHSFYCRRESCAVTTCSMLKRLLRHLRLCSSGRQCPLRQCYPTSIIFRHWRGCAKHDCNICMPVIAATKRVAERERRRRMLQVKTRLLNRLNHIL
ncbi:histone acetyltransferase [Trichonephila clavata]|uniref:histone acetyltransferase n=1 Tax=Trichonephila clavata TaxID=2740835 RepID=A0A8X6JHA9_TRICU|nr:histone acetyltransferase [Trichonephila clavata]